MRTYRIEMRLIQATVVLGVLVVIAGFFGTWGNSKNPVQDTSASASTSGKVDEGQSLQDSKIVALGDSFTYGYPLGPDHSWVEVLAEKLQVPVVNKGKTLQSSKDLLSRFDSDVVPEKPGRVIVFGGDGDALRSVPLKEFQTNIQALVDKARSNHIIPVLALPLPYPGVQATLKEMRSWMLEYAQKERILVLDFASAVMDADGKYLEGLSVDKKYPTEKGYQAMGEYAARVLK